jgi:glycine/D-amino acid oxidase-like deaminating enzyme/nitrite reductase/ring-hydroxylating ferredoxin subunit
MNTQSLWQAVSPPAEFPALNEDIAADVAVVGGGITGVMAALHVSRAGKRVVLVEAETIGCSATGGSTGNLYATVDEHLFGLREKWSMDTVRAVVESRRAAIETIRQLVEEYDIDCGLAPRDFHLYATANASDDEKDAVNREYEAARETGLDASLVDALPLPFAISRATVIRDQAQFNPLAYVRGLVRGLNENCRVFEHTPATRIDPSERTVETDTGRIKADAIVLATHTPKGVYGVQLTLATAREYGVAARLNDARYPDGIFWSADQPKHSIRSFESDGERYLLVIGGKHATGKGRAADYLDRLETFTREHYDVGSVTHCWSAQHYRSSDRLPFIGPSLRASNVHIATGFATDGLVYGAVAARIIADAIAGRDNRWRDIYKADRFTPAKSAEQLISKNLEVAAELGKKLLATDAGKQFDEVPRGGGKLIECNGDKLAVYRDEQGRVTALGATCPHLGCDVHFNDVEKTWDCPCHGSRFRCDGSVIEGPAMRPLHRQGA